MTTDSQPLTVKPLPFAAARALGVRPAGDGLDVAVLATQATAVEFCVLSSEDPQGHERRVPLFGPWDGIWHGHIAGIGVGTHYGLRADGDWNPAGGLRFNRDKLLLDPYARAIGREPQLSPLLFAHTVDDDYAPKGESPQRDARDSAAVAASAVVISDDFDWGGVTRPYVPWEDTVLYEAHVKGLTMRNPDVPEELRGTYAGLAHPAMIEYLTELGVTTIELLPIHASFSEIALLRRGVTNYWGYNTLGYFAPNPRYASAANRAAGPQAVVDEVKGMIKLLHAAGIEVVLDVVYNHTCEGGTDGPMLSWRGLDPLSYYRHDSASAASFQDMTGCGNTLDFRRAGVVGMTLDSLRYWAEQYQVDGFRYDLAVTLARGHDGFNPDHPFLVALQTDPVLRGLKHIAEPWDLGPGGWATGGFPTPMAAWNDQFRNATRSFWLSSPQAQSHGGSGSGLTELASRLSGSADVFGTGAYPGARGPLASVNYVTAHDGFTMADLVSYDHKHNDANGEGNRDGSDDNRSWNHGMEGPVPRGVGADLISSLRRRSIRNLMGTLLLAAGIPMITAGDEFARTQRGNNNAYCQDSDISYVSWDLEPWQMDLHVLTALLLRLRAANPALRPTRYFTGQAAPGQDRPDLAWFDVAGAAMTQETWTDPAVGVVQMLRAAPLPGARDALVVINGSLDAIEVVLADGHRREYELAWDSSWDSLEQSATTSMALELHASSHEKVFLDPLSIRLYLSLG